MIVLKDIIFAVGFHAVLALQILAALTSMTLGQPAIAELTDVFNAQQTRIAVEAMCVLRTTVCIFVEHLVLVRPQLVQVVSAYSFLTEAVAVVFIA